MTNHFEAAAEKLKTAIQKNPLHNTVTDKLESCPTDIDVTLTASSHSIGNHQIMPMRIGHFTDSEDEQKPEILTAKVKIEEGFGYDSVKKALLDGMEKLLELKMPDGSLLSSHINLSGKEEPTHKEKTACLKKQLTELVAQNEAHFTPAEKSLLNSKALDPEVEKHTYHYNILEENEKGVTVLNMSIRDWGGNVEKDLHLEGATSLQSRIEENLEKRKPEIIQGIKNYLNTAIVKDSSDKDVSLLSQFTEAEILELKKMEAVIDVKGSGNVISTRFILGQPVDDKDKKPDATPEDNLKEIPALKKIPTEILQKAITNSMLLAGEKAEDIAPIISDTSSIKNLLEEKVELLEKLEEKAKLPELVEKINKVLHGNELLMSRDEIEAKEKTAKPKAVVSEPYLVKKDSFVDVVVELPKGITVGNVIGSIENIAPLKIKSDAKEVVGEHTAALQKQAANKENYKQLVNL